MTSRIVPVLAALLAVSVARAERIELHGHASSCVVDTCGGRILSYVEDGVELLWTPLDEPGDEPCWRHGGIPLAWPWFGRLGRGDEDIHGYAWKREFKVISRSADSLVLELGSGPLRLSYAISLRDALRLELCTVNRSPDPMPVAMAFHPYFRVGRTDRSFVFGVEPDSVAVTGAVDRTVLFDRAEPEKTFGIRDEMRGRTLRIVAEGATGVNLWNPGPEKKCPGRIPGDTWRNFVAVEPFARGVNRFVVLEPGSEFRLAMTIGCRLSASGGDLPLPGEPCSKPPVSCSPFPDRMSAYVWRNWFVVPHARLATAVGATEADLEDVAADMGLPRKVDVLPEWRRKGYITVVRRNWHLLDYAQLLQVVDMTREELAFSLMEDDFLFVKLGNMKPKCGALRWNGAEVEQGKAARRRIAAALEKEGIDPSVHEEPRFAFVKELSSQTSSNPQPATHDTQPTTSPFDFRLIFSYFADYADPLWDPEVASYPEGLLQKLSSQGVNAVWLHTVLRTLAKDPKYPEFGEGSERRLANLQTLVRRCDRYGIKVFLYMNEPRAMPDAFFAGKPERESFRGCDNKDWPLYAMCTSVPEVRRWVRDSVESVFKRVPGLGGIFTITMSENLTNCASRGDKDRCPRCRKRGSSEIVAEINAAMIDGMLAGNPNAVALLYDWAWDQTDEGKAGVMRRLPKRNVRVLSVSERGIPVARGGKDVTVSDYAISVVGPGDSARQTWKLARENGIPTTAKVQANCSWEIAAFPYLPVMDLVAEHALNLVREGVDGVMLSWSHGCCPAPNLAVFRDVRKSDADKSAVLDRIAANLYGVQARPLVRQAWTSFAEGYRHYPFSCDVVYNGPQQMGPANPLYLQRTGYDATMVGIPYDDVSGWCAEYPADVWAAQMAKVRDGFDKGCELFGAAIARMPAEIRPSAERELRMFRGEALHFRSCVDQVAFYRCRGENDVAGMRREAERELASAKELLDLACRDSRFGFESSNQYFYIPQDLREKIVACRLFLDGCQLPSAN